MKNEYVVIFYGTRRRKADDPGTENAPYYNPNGGYAKQALRNGQAWTRAVRDATNPAMCTVKAYTSKAEAEAAAKDLLEDGFSNVGVFQKLGEFAPTEPVWQEVGD